MKKQEHEMILKEIYEKALATTIKEFDERYMHIWKEEHADEFENRLTGALSALDNMLSAMYWKLDKEWVVSKDNELTETYYKYSNPLNALRVQLREEERGY